jgi:hypothetical protein
VSRSPFGVRWSCGVGRCVDAWACMAVAERPQRGARSAPGWVRSGVVRRGCWLERRALGLGSCGSVVAAAVCASAPARGCSMLVSLEGAHDLLRQAGTCNVKSVSRPGSRRTTVPHNPTASTVCVQYPTTANTLSWLVVSDTITDYSTQYTAVRTTQDSA